MSIEHKIGDYLYKNGDIYKIIPHWDDFIAPGLFSVFLQESTGKIYRSPYLIDKNDASYSPATVEQMKKFDSIEKRTDDY